MKKKLSIIIILLIIIGIIVAVILFSKSKQSLEGKKYYLENKNGDKINTSEKIKEEKKYNEELSFQNIKINYYKEANTTVITCDVLNLTNNIIESNFYDLALLDSDGKELVSATTNILTLQVGELRKISIVLYDDYTNIYDITVKEYITYN